MDSNTIINGAYHSTILSGLVFANCILSKNMFKTTPPNLGQLDMTNISKLTLNIYIAMMTKNLLIKQGILPPNINPIPK